MKKVIADFWDNNRKIILALCLVVLVVFGRSVLFGFTYHDDQALILERIGFLRNPANILQAFNQDAFALTGSMAAYYRPIFTISLMLDAFVSGVNPYLYHFTNVLLHAITVALLYIFLLKVSVNKKTAFGLSLLFAVHPLHSQAVYWIPGRNDILLAIFSLSSLIYMVSYAKDGKPKDYFLTFVFFSLALFTKESALFLIPIYALVVYTKRSAFGRVLNLFYPTLIIFLVWYFLREFAFGQDRINYSTEAILASLTYGFRAIPIYIAKAILPLNLSVFPTIDDFNLVHAILAFIVIFLIVVYSKVHSNKTILLGLSIFFLTLIPSFIRPNLTYQPDFLEHRMYLPLIGVVVFLSGLSVIGNFFQKRLFLLSILVVIFAVLTINNGEFYKDRMSYWQKAVKDSPNHSMTRKNLGAMYYLAGDLEKAEDEFEKSLEVNPLELQARNNLGLIAVSRGDYESAENYYQEEIKINPGYSDVYYNYGILMYVWGKKEKTEKLWLTALKLNPQNPDIYRNLAAYYSEVGDNEKSQLYGRYLK